MTAQRYAQDENLSWEKPSWTKDRKLKSTQNGTMAVKRGNLASEITMLPQHASEKQIGWSKPEWAVDGGPKLRATGKAQVMKTQGNLALPITTLPHLSSNKAETGPRTTTSVDMQKLSTKSGSIGNTKSILDSENNRKIANKTTPKGAKIEWSRTKSVNSPTTGNLAAVPRNPEASALSKMDTPSMFRSFLDNEKKCDVSSGHPVKSTTICEGGQRASVLEQSPSMALSKAEAERGTSGMVETSKNKDLMLKELLESKKEQLAKLKKKSQQKRHVQRETLSPSQANKVASQEDNMQHALSPSRTSNPASSAANELIPPSTLSDSAEEPKRPASATSEIEMNQVQASTEGSNPAPEAPEGSISIPTSPAIPSVTETPASIPEILSSTRSPSPEPPAMATRTQNKPKSTFSKMFQKFKPSFKKLNKKGKKNRQQFHHNPMAMATVAEEEPEEEPCRMVPSGAEDLTDSKEVLISDIPPTAVSSITTVDSNIESELVDGNDYDEQTCISEYYDEQTYISESYCEEEQTVMSEYEEMTYISDNNQDVTEYSYEEVTCLDEEEVIEDFIPCTNTPQATNQKVVLEGMGNVLVSIA